MRSLVLALAAGFLTWAPASAENFSKPEIGLSIEKPDEWRVLSAEANIADRQKFERDNPRLGAANHDHGEVLLFAFTRYRPPYEGLTATVKVSKRDAGPLQGQSGQQIAQAMLPVLEELVPDLKVVSPPETVTLAGKQAGHMALTFSLRADSSPILVATDAWFIPRGAYYLLVGATYPPDDKFGDRAAAMQIVNSLQLTN